MINRIIAIFIDLVLAGFIGALLNIVPFEFPIKEDISFYIAFTFVILKDNLLITGSLGKKLVGLEMHEKNHSWSVRLRNAARNIFLLIWPIEFILVILHPKNQRLGDLIFGTKVIMKNEN